MPITSSAKKALRASKKKQVFNVRRKDEFKDITKQIKKLVAGGKTDQAKALLPKAYKAIDKASKGKTIKKNTASRKKSRLAKLIKKSAK